MEYLINLLLLSCDDIFIEIVRFYFKCIMYFLSDDVRYFVNFINEEFIVEVNVVISEGCFLLKIKKVDIVFWVVVFLYIFNVVVNKFIKGEELIILE